MTVKKVFIESINKGPFRQRLEDDKVIKFCDNDEKLFFDAIYQGYLDASRRFKIGNIIEYASRRDDIFRKLANGIMEYFKGDAPCDWDTYTDEHHKKWCILLKDEFQKIGVNNMSFGLAQKVVNMAFKYLYCCEDSEKYSVHFAYCHMALDSYTLNWYRRNCAICNVEKWSNISTYENYRTIQKDIKEKIGESLNVIDAEYIIWSMEILLRASEECKKAQEVYQDAENIFKKYVDCAEYKDAIIDKGILEKCNLMSNV